MQLIARRKPLYLAQCCPGARHPTWQNVSPSLYTSISLPSCLCQCQGSSACSSHSFCPLLELPQPQPRLWPVSQGKPGQHLPSLLSVPDQQCLYVVISSYFPFSFDYFRVARICVATAFGPSDLDTTTSTTQRLDPRSTTSLHPLHSGIEGHYSSV